MGSESQEGVLVQIPFSHYNERARWALTWAGVPYRNVRAVPFLHLPVVLYYQRKFQIAKSADDKTGSPLSTPFLGVFGSDGCPESACPDSDSIMLYADAYAVKHGHTALWPPAGQQADECQELCKKFHDILGPAVRTIAYSDLLKFKWKSFTAYRQLAYNNVGLGQTAFWVVMWPVIGPMLSSSFKTNPRNVERKRQQILEMFEELGQRLEKHAQEANTTVDQVYLCGTSTPSAADVTLAALGGILVGITHAHGYGAWIPDIDGFAGEESREYVLKLKATTAGQHIYRMYANHRHGSS